jgi:hypothetical protein
MALDANTRRSRRALLLGAAGSLAALTAQALGRPTAVRADGEAILVGGRYETADQTTTIMNHKNGNTALWVTSDAGDGLHGQSETQKGVWAISQSGTALYATSDTGVGLAAQNAGGLDPMSPAIFGVNVGVGGVSVYGVKVNHGTAVWGNIDDSTNSDGSVVGTTNGKGPGVRGANSANGRGVWGRAVGSGDGVYGISLGGRGGRFNGKKAAIRLDPSTAATHPTSGARGDLFVDAFGHLWFCRGDTVWAKLA